MNTHRSFSSSQGLHSKLSLWKAAVASVLFSLATLGAISANATPATWVVDDLGDSTPAPAHHTLRTAVAAAAPGDFIEFSQAAFAGNLPKTLILTKGTITIAKDLTIVGPGDGATNHVPMLQIEGNGTSRVFQINSPATVTLSGLGIRKGYGAGGGGVLVAPGARLNLIECDLTDCTASGKNAGGAVLNQGSLLIDLCLIARNKAYDGGGIASTGNLQITRSLIQGNVAANDGGGIHSGAAPFTMESSTVSDNKAGAGGGIVVVASGKTQGLATLTAATVVGNRAYAQSGGLYVEGSAALAKVGGSLFTNNLVVKDDDCADADKTPRDLAVQKSGKISSTDYNLVSKPGGTFSPYGAHDQYNVDPLIGALAYNGGRTQTYLPAQSSLAIGRGNPAFAGLLVPTDQRGFPRTSPQPGGTVDVGAVELTGPNLSLPPEFVFECTGLQTSGVLKAGLTLPGGGVASVTWTINGVSMPAVSVTVPDTETAIELTQTGLFNLGTNLAKVKVTANSFAVERGTTVTVKDTTAPVINVNGASPTTIEWGTLYTDAGASVTDICDPAPTLAVTLPFPAGSLYPTGTFSVLYKATDASGNSSTATRVVSVLDTVKPVISLIGSPVVYVEWGTAYVEPGATASDNHDGTVAVTIDASNVKSELGTYQVRYNAKDSAGNQAVEVTRTVIVRDTIRPVITASGDPTVYVEWGTAYQEPGASALDNHDGPVTVSITGIVNTAVLGTYLVTYNATDASQNQAVPVYRTVIVRDTTPPEISLNQPAPLTVIWGATFTDPGATAVDNHDGPVAVKSVSNVNTCVPGQYDVTYTAADSSGNTQTATRVVTVLNTVSLSVSTVSRDVDPATGTVGIDLAQAVSGIQSTSCGNQVRYQVTITKLPAKAGEIPKILAELSNLTSLPTYQFPAGTSSVRIVVSVEGGSQPLLDSNFTVQVADPNNVTLPNVAWPLALELPTSQNPTNSRLTVGNFKQMIARSGESRWFKIHGAPGSKITVTLKKLPANFDLVVYSDIREEFEELMSLLGSNDAQKQKQALLGAQSSQEAYLQEAYLQEAYLQEAYLQEAYLQEAYLQEAYLPDAFFQEAYLPETYSQEAYLQEAYLQEAYLQEAYLPEAFSNAQLKSLVSFSAAQGTADENVRFNTYSLSGDFYIRVRGNNGLYSLDAPFELEVKILQDLAANITDQDTTPALNPAIAGTPTSLLLWDSARLPGTATEKSSLATALASFAAAANGVVIDLATDTRIAALNAQADANTAIPLAKNLVAETIRNLILRCRATAPSIRDITLVGSDDVIPFFRKNDGAQLAGEFNYYPPVKDGTHSQSSLRLNQVLTQDRYGSSTQISLATGPYDLPELPVGRLVENATEIQAYLNAYAPLFNGSSTSGTLPTPRTAFVSGYEFLADSAEAMRDDFAAGLGLGGTVDTLISPANLPPAQGWNADQLRAAFLGSRHDIAYLGGHFSGGGTLAADYKTRMTAKEMDLASVNLQYSLVLSTGCHSGYNTIDGDSIALLTEQPDWAQAFARKKAIWISGTGYQYGDTDFVEYTERLQLEVARALRTGSGPISIGQALNSAKRRYLTDTAVMRGIHEKTLLQLTLYGLPMVKINVAGGRLTSPSNSGDVGYSTAVTGVGGPLGLRTGDITLVPSLTKVDRTLGVLGTNTSVVASYYTGASGFISVPGEPVRALESLNVSRPTDGLVRGIGFRGGDYTDAKDFLPFIGVPVTESSGIHGRFYTEVFYPVGTWSLNQAGELGTDSAVGSKLNVFPTQFMSDGPESPTGFLRKFDRLQFSVFYSPNVSATALASAPALNHIETQLSGNQVTFAVEAATAKEAGVQEVWITYTGLAGSPYFGKWRSLTLTAPANAAGIGTWTGTLLLNNAGDAAGIRYMVQAVNGVGAVVQSTNFGRFYTIGSSTQDAAAARLPVNLSLSGPVVTSAAYRTALPVQARLTDQSGLPLAGRMVRFSVGPAIKSALTDSAGMASTSLTVNASPGPYQLEASFGGDPDHASATDSRPITITKQGTKLTPMAVNLVTQASDVYFDLSALDGSPVGERAVVLFLKDLATPAAPTALVAVTNNLGRVRLPDNGIANGTYSLTAYFAKPVVLPTGETVPLDDPLYGPAEAVVTFTLSPALIFKNEQAWLSYSDLTAPKATSSNRGLTRTEIMGDIKAQAPGFNPKSIPATNSSMSVWATIRASMSGKSIADGPIKLTVQSADGLHWRASGMINGVSVQLYVDWDDDGNNPGKYHVWITTPAGTGPLYKDTPTILRFDLTLGTGAGEHSVGGTSVIGGPEKPWTQQNNNSRVRTAK